ncbi:MAG: serine/threonine-protein phosphatase [Planctomycetaceae bacterium]|nr:serine/threonine-protein phosphatase [Planctomycetaceae bacterium]
MAGRMDCYGDSHVGMVRDRNEDQFLIADLKKSVVIHHTSLSYDDETELHGGSQAKLMLVADGVGGHAAGERASCLALEGVVQYLLNAMHWIFKPEDDREDAFLDDLKSALAFSQERIQHAAEAVPDQQGMGTTITMAYVVWPHVYLVHAGDSRAYLYRNRELVRLTHDQTYAQALADAGVFAPEQIEKSPLNHVLSSLVGCNPDHLDPQVYKSSLQLNDTLLLCTDGLTRHLTDSQIGEILQSDRSARECCEHLIARANDAGGKDNTTVIVARFGDGRHSPPRHQYAQADTGAESAVSAQAGSAVG